MPDHDLLDRILGDVPDARDRAAAETARALERSLDALPLPDAALPGWQSLCAAEYAEAVTALVRAVRAARSALTTASAAAR